MAKGKSTYEFRNGDIYRRGDLVGTYDTVTNTLVELRSDLPKQIRSILSNKLAGMSRTAVNETQMVNPAISTNEFASYQPVPNALKRNMTVPDAPRMDPKLGDKTPAYVEWMYRWFPVDAEARYRGRKVSLDAVSDMGADIPKIPMDEPEEEWK
jgi:hypothetical protein